MKKSDVIWSVSQKQYNMLNEQYEELQKKQISHSLENWITLYYTLPILQKSKRKTEQKVNQQNNQEK